MIRRLNRDERGVTAIVAVVCLLGIFGAATLSVDAGNLWQSRRNMVTATDAAALAEARDFAINSLGGGTPSGCTGLYNTILDRNAGTDVYDRSCTVVPFSGTGTGYVSVEGRKPVDVRFGVVLGLDDTAAYSMSAAMIGYPTSAHGLRPIAYCVENGHVQEWLELQALLNDGDPSNDAAAWDQYNSLMDVEDVLAHPWLGPQGQNYKFGLDSNGQPYGVVHRMYFNKSNEDGACGDFPGNWGWLNFDGGTGGVGTPEVNEWLEDGYTGVQVPVVSNGDPVVSGDEDECVGEPGNGTESNPDEPLNSTEEGCTPAKPGALASSVRGALESVQDQEVYITIFDAGACAGSGGGATCTFETVAFLGVKIRGWQLGGPEDLRFFDFSFFNAITSGSCCSMNGPANGIDTGIRAVKLCAVDHDAFAIDADNRCGAG